MVTPIATFSGLATGIDSNALIRQLVNLERRPINRIKSQQSDINSIVSRLSSIKTKLEALQSASQKMDARDEFLKSKATSADETKFTATAAAGSSLGSFNVNITNIATAQRTYSSTFAAKDNAALLDDGSFKITIGAVEKTVTVTATDTLESLVSKINGSGAAVSAGLFYDGTNYRLQINGNKTGAANAITFTETGTNLGLQGSTPVQAATNANFLIDGFAMTSASNTVTTAIPGVNIELLASTSGSNVALKVARDPEAVKSALQEFVDAYNGVMRAIGSEFAFTGEARLGDSLSADSTLRGLQTALRSTVGAQNASLAAPYNALVNVGVKSDSKGVLSVDSAVFDAAFGANAEAVTAFFINDPNTGISGLMSQMDALIKQYVKTGDGILSSKIDGLKTRVDDMDDQITNMELQVNKFEERTRQQFASLESLVSSLQSQGSQMLSALGSLTNQR